MAATTHIGNQIYMSLKIQDTDMTESPNLVSSITLCENVMQMTPVLQFTFNDLSSALVRDLALTEGTKFEIMLGKTQESAVTRKFRLFGMKKVDSREGPKIVANFILDCPKYITGTFTESFEGTSSAVMSEIASRCGLTADVSTTSDQQIWLNFGQTRAAFAEDVAIHGYANETSCMYRALTSEHVLVYKDAIGELNKGSPKITISLNAEDGAGKIIQARDIRDVSVSGVMNTWLNYGWKYPEHSLSGDEQLNSEYNVQTTEQYLPINSEVKDEVKGARLEYCTKLDCRNTHKNYNKAYYINMRGRSLLAERMHVLIEEPSELQLLDVVEYRHVDGAQRTGKATGNYIVTAKTVHIAPGGAYSEKLELCRASLREAGNTPLMG